MFNELDQCIACHKNPSKHTLITGEHVCVGCDMSLCIIGLNRLKYEASNKMLTKRWVKTFITPEEIQRFDDSPQHSITYSKQWSEPDEYMKEVNLKEIVYIKDHADGEYFATYLSTPV